MNHAMQEATGLEWVALTPDTILVSAPERTCLCNTDTPLARGFGTTMDHPSSPAATRRFLESCVAAAKTGMAKGGQARPPLTLLRWVYRLCGAYHTTHATPPTMQEAARLFASSGRHLLADYAISKVKKLATTR
jgi:hypothetical protein